MSGTLRHKRDFATDSRLLRLVAMAAVIGAVATLAAWVLLNLIRFFTNLFFYQALSLAGRSPVDHRLGAPVILIPAIGGLVVGIGRSRAAAATSTASTASIRWSASTSTT